METSKLIKNKSTYIALVLLNIHLINGAVVSSTSGEEYFGESFSITFTITPSFTVSATVSQDGTIVSTCIPSVCGPNSDNNVTFTPSGTGITVVFNPVSSSHQGDWECVNSNGDNIVYSFSPVARPSETTTDGLPVGAYVAIALCALIGVVLVVVGVSCKLLHRNQAHQNPPTPAPEVTIEIIDYECPKGYTVKLIVVVVSVTPITDICWQKKVGDDLIPIKLSAYTSKYRGSSKNDPSLTICDVCSIDSGEYRCLATNSSGQGQSTRTATLSVIAKAREYEATVGSKVDLLPSLCDIKNVASVKWKHDRKQNLTFEDVEGLTNKGGIDIHPSLTIRWVSLEDIGTWRCFLETETSKHVIDAQLKIKEKHMEAKVGSKVELLPELCEINDIEKVEWRHNNQAPDKPSNFMEDGRPSYTIEKAVCENSGT